MRTSVKQFKERYPGTPEELVEQGALDSLVDNFQCEMKSRLREKLEEGRSGWEDGSAMPRGRLHNALEDAADAERWVDVANLSAILWNLAQPSPETEGDSNG